jgi:hypothetical protein
MLSDSAKVEQMYDELAVNPATPLVEPENDAEMSKYIYPTLIILPIIIVIILVLFSSAEKIIKFLVTILALITCVAFYMKQQNINIVKFTNKQRSGY